MAAGVEGADGNSVVDCVRSGRRHHRQAPDPGRDPGGFIITTLLGIAGALIGGFIGQALNWYEPNQPAGWLMSIAGAVLLLVLYRVAFKRRA